MCAAFRLLKLIAGFVYGIAPRNPRTLAAAGVTMVIVALGAALLPAACAGRTPPVDALKED